MKKRQIQNACWLGEDGWFHWGKLFLEDGRIARLESDHASDEPEKGPAPEPLPWKAATRRLDAGGVFIVPGLVESHSPAPC